MLGAKVSFYKNDHGNVFECPIQSGLILLMIRYIVHDFTNKRQYIYFIYRLFVKDIYCNGGGTIWHVYHEWVVW